MVRIYTESRNGKPRWRGQGDEEGFRFEIVVCFNLADNATRVRPCLTCLKMVPYLCRQSLRLLFNLLDFVVIQKTWL